jgi:hypothetical protein
MLAAHSANVFDFERIRSMRCVLGENRTSAAVSPGNKLRFIAKHHARAIIRAHATGERSGKGSHACVTESSAIARVEFSSLSKTGRRLRVYATIRAIQKAAQQKPQSRSKRAVSVNRS